MSGTTIVLPDAPVATAVVSVPQTLAALRIPVKPSTHQTFLVQLAGVEYRFTLQWREIGLKAWLLDIADNLGNMIIGGIVLVTGANLLAQYKHINFGGELWVWNAADRSAMPTFDSLGDTVNLYFVTGGTLNWTFL